MSLLAYLIVFAGVCYIPHLFVVVPDFFVVFPGFSMSFLAFLMSVAIFDPAGPRAEMQIFKNVKNNVFPTFLKWRGRLFRMIFRQNRLPGADLFSGRFVGRFLFQY